jgi:hypothetical protein
MDLVGQDSHDRHGEAWTFVPWEVFLHCCSPCPESLRKDLQWIDDGSCWQGPTCCDAMEVPFCVFSLVPKTATSAFQKSIFYWIIKKGNKSVYSVFHKTAAATTTMRKCLQRKSICVPDDERTFLMQMSMINTKTCFKKWHSAFTFSIFPSLLFPFVITIWLYARVNSSRSSLCILLWCTAHSSHHLLLCHVKASVDVTSLWEATNQSAILAPTDQVITKMPLCLQVDLLRVFDLVP